MSEEEARAEAVCKDYYDACMRRDVEGALKVFSDKSILTVGAGGSARAVEYSGVFKGLDQIREHDVQRFAKRLQGKSVLRPLCAVLPVRPICLPFVVFCFDIEDTLVDKTPTFKGKALNVWTIYDGHVSAMDIYFDVRGRLSPIEAGLMPSKVD